MSPPDRNRSDDDETPGGEAEELPDLLELPEPSASVTAFWESVGIDPVLISLPGGSGLTLRHHHQVDADIEDSAVAGSDGEQTAEPDQADDAACTLEPDPEAEDREDSEEEQEGVAQPRVGWNRTGVVQGEGTEIEPRFLGNGAYLYLFRTPAALVAFVRSDAPHALTDAPAWQTVREAPDLDPTPQLLNRYELDLVVDIARAGSDGWGKQEQQTLLLAGELARDASAFCVLPEVQAMLAPGSPLDALDDDLRAGGLRARWRLRRYNADQIALSWRRIVREIGTKAELR